MFTGKCQVKLRAGWSGLTGLEVVQGKSSTTAPRKPMKWNIVKWFLASSLGMTTQNERHFPVSALGVTVAFHPVYTTIQKKRLAFFTKARVLNVYKNKKLIGTASEGNTNCPLNCLQVNEKQSKNFCSHFSTFKDKNINYFTGCG